MRLILNWHFKGNVDIYILSSAARSTLVMRQSEAISSHHVTNPCINFLRSTSLLPYISSLLVPESSTRELSLATDAMWRLDRRIWKARHSGADWPLTHERGKQAAFPRSTSWCCKMYRDDNQLARLLGLHWCTEFILLGSSGGEPLTMNLCSELGSFWMDWPYSISRSILFLV